MGKLKFIAALCVCGTFFCADASFVFSAFCADRTVVPVNTTLAVDTASFSKNDFILKLQQTLASGTVKDALALYDEVPENFAEDEDLLVLKASLLISDNQLNNAKTICLDLNRKNPSDATVIELLAYIAKLQGDSGNQNKYLKTLLAQDQYNVTANVEMAQSMFENKNYKQARLYYQKALVREPDNEDVLFGLGQADYFLGSKDPSKDKEAESTFKKILENNPDYAPAYSYLGKLAAADNRYKIASDYVKQAIAIDQTNYNYFIDYGMYESNLGHYDAAIQAWTDAISIQPKYFLAYAYRAGVYDEQNQIDKAVSDYKSVVAYNPNYYFAYESLGILSLKQCDWKTARESFEKCYEMDKTSNISYPLMITYCYYKEGNKLKAKSFSDKVLRKLDRNSIDYAMLRVWHDESGEMPLPQKISALDNANKKGKMYFYLGLYYENFGGVEIARENYAKVISMHNPMFFEYRLAEWSMGSDNVIKVQ
ncbi:MAG: tetratricopeptide repeat protein [Treponema sp.]|nr:tetratricopeptide repeat protein [Treponema sp.]